MDTNFMARIMANIRDFQNNVRKAQRLAETSVPKEINVDIDAKLTKLQTKLKRAKGILTTIPPRKEIDIDADIQKATTNLKRVTTTLYRVPPRKDIDVDAQIQGAQTKLKRITSTLYSMPRHKEINVDADTAKANFQLTRVKQTLYTIPPKKTINVDVDSTGMAKVMAEIALLKAGLSMLDERTSSIGRSGADGFNTMRGSVMASTQAVMMFVGKLGLILPLIAGIIPVVFALLNAIGALSGGIVALGGAVGIGFGGVVAYALMAKSAIQMLNDGTIKASAATKKYQTALEGVKTTWEGIIKQNVNAIFESMANGLNTVKTALSALKPMFKGIANGVNEASQKMLEWAKNSQVAHKFFQMMNTTGVSVFKKLLSAAGHFGDGLINVFTQLAPLFQWCANWLNRLGASFQKWANSAAGQNSIKQFIEYTKTNLPIIGNIFKDVFIGIFNLMKAFGANSTQIFKYLEQMSEKFRNWSETVGNSPGFKKFIEYMQKNGPLLMDLLGSIIRILVAFAIAMAPIAHAVLSVVTPIAQFIAKLFETHPAVAQAVGILGLLGMALKILSGPFMLVKRVLDFFGISLLDVGKKVFGFIKNSGLLRGILNVLKTAFTLLRNPVASLARLLPALGTAFEVLGGPIGWIIGIILALVGVIVYLWKTNEGFRNMIINAWNGIVSAISGAVSSVINWFMQLWGSIQSTLKPIMPVLQWLGQMFMQILGVLVIGIIQVLIFTFQSLWNAISIIFTAIGGIISVVVQIIVGLFTILIQLITGDFSGAWQTLQTTVQNVMSTIWDTLVSIWNQISNFIFNTLNKILGTNIKSWGDIWQAIVSAVTRIWNAVSNWFTRVAHTVAVKMGLALSHIISKAAQWVSSIIQGMAKFVQGVVNGFLRVVSNVANGMQRAVGKVKSFFGQMLSAGKYIISGLAQGIMNGASTVINAAANVAKRAISAAKSALGIHSPSKVFKGIGQYVSQGLGLGILADKNRAIDAVRNVSSSLIDAFQPNLGTNLSSNLTDGLNDSLGGSVDAHMTRDVRHSMQENNRPIVNVAVHNESDVDAIKSYIEEVNSKDANYSLD